MRQITLDTETTGLDPKEGHRVIEIGAVEMINRHVTGKHLHLYINPERDIDAAALAVHGIQSDFLLKQPLFKAVATQLIDFIRDAEVIIHNAPFDLSFLDNEFALSEQANIKIENYCRVIDTLSLARQLHPGQRNNLDALCKRYNINNKHRELHGALLDAELLAQVYLAMTGGQGNLFEEEIQTIYFIPDNPIKTSSSITPPKRNLKVVYATEEELKTHKAYLKKLKDCLWDK